MAKPVAKGAEAIAKLKQKEGRKRVELLIWYEGSKQRKKIVAAA